VTGWREDAEIVITVAPPRWLAASLPPAELGPFPAAWPGRCERAAWIEAGVPHLCLLFHDAAAGEAPPMPPEEQLTLVGRRLRGAPRFLPGGTNVDFIWTGETPGVARLRTYERGVEGLTRACGSGALAAAALLLRGAPAGVATLEVASETLLRVEKKEPAWTLRGPAEPLARGVFRWEEGAAANEPPESRD
jgi:diaminopimelate epimerase